MTLGNPTVTVTCDSCQTEESFSLDVTAKGYDERTLKARIEEAGWYCEHDGTHFCSDCHDPGEDIDTMHLGDEQLLKECKNRGLVK